MPDDKRSFLPEDEPDIHKEDTEEIIIIPEDPYEQHTEDIAALHASDPPLERGLPEDESLLYRVSRTDTGKDTPLTETLVDFEDENTLQHRYDDDDVPFRLPRSEDLTAPSEGQVPNKWVTMPNEVPADQRQQHTMPAPRRPEQTLQHQPVAQPTIPREDYQRFQRPSVAAPVPHPNIPAPPTPQQQAGAQRLPKRRRRGRTNMGCLAIALGLFLTFCGGLTFFSVIGGVYAYARVGDLLNDRIDEVDRYSAFQSTFLYDRKGRQLYEVFNEGRRTNASIEEMPQNLINATIAIEDDSFYSNIGIDIPATTIALLSYVGAGGDENTAGGSTITQQLVRNVLFDPQYRAERSPQRKAEEIFLAIALTGRKSKEEILELYLNEIYYGNLAYGAQAAANVFFGKDVGELTLGEAAMLAGLPQAPAELDPLNPDPTIQAAVNARWRQVLTEMVEEGFITQTEMNDALAQGLAFNPQDVPLEAPHFTVYAQLQLERLLTEIGYSVEEVAKGGYHVYTTVDIDLNERVRQIAANQVANLSANNVSNAAVVVLKPITGEIMAMVGSIDYNNDAIDGRVNVTTAFRQPGSTMKAFTYAAAIERGFSAGDVIWDTRVSISQFSGEPYVPRNYDGAFHGPMRMRTALSNSYNIPAVQTLRYVGVDYLLGLMARFGVESLGTDASLYGLSLTLGGGEISPLELTRAYSVFANQGALVDSTAILCIMNNDDEIVYEFENYCPDNAITTDRSVVRNGLGTQVLDPRIAYLISDMLADNGARTPAMGANSPLLTPNILTSVKTGTTNDVKDNWTVGFTSNVAVGVWVGNNNGDPMVNSSGLTGAAPIWNSVITEIYANTNYLSEFALDNQLQNDQRSAPSGMSLVQLCDVRNLVDPATSCNSGTVNEWLLDSKAAVPDGSGSLVYPDGPFREPVQDNNVQEVEPGIYRARVYRLNPAVAAAIQFDVQPGDRRPPAPKYCRALPEQAGTPGVQELFFIAPPFTSASQSDVAEAEEYANARNLAFLPTINCTPELIAAGPGSFGTGGASVTAFISSPQSGATVSPGTPIMGTADFGPTQASYFKIDIIGGQWSEWTTLADVVRNPVVNGQLGVIPAAVPPGNYRIRLLIAGPDQNTLQEPFEIAVTVQ